jgi:hypothetical protein
VVKRRRPAIESSSAAPKRARSSSPSTTKARVRLAGGREIPLDADVQLPPVRQREPHAAAAAQRLRLLLLREAQQPAEERAGRALAIRRRGELHVIEAGHTHEQGLVMWPVTLPGSWVVSTKREAVIARRQGWLPW